ncbi:DoxX family protein [Pseudoroseicyclus aestuarii]|uniref:Putative oxidoreductase n=1 Tax=Pseudoroseicyclus aestuarii TaxID=1795041 RepID=A0A318SMH2_9RHOB|nr:DoxX family membrane protein [Pseudoroseicyclus aestuarii]PYE81240.1 putative oxidoreductase [Pseudoroseicyclus aestuarii]
MQDIGGRGDAALLLLARLALAALMLGGAAQKALSPGDAMALLAERGLPQALVWPALAYDAAAGVALVLGWRMRPLALSLAVYCAFTSWFHFKPEDPWQMTIFVKNWAIAGGCCALAVAGAGPWRLGRRG